jgi:hypothetical protein
MPGDARTVPFSDVIGTNKLIIDVIISETSRIIIECQYINGLWLFRDIRSTGTKIYRMVRSKVC